jgi:hypothetical protein
MGGGCKAFSLIATRNGGGLDLNHDRTSLMANTVKSSCYYKDSYVQHRRERIQ